MLPLHQTFIRQAKRHASSIAIVDRNTRRTTTYGRALVGALLLARRFRRYPDGYVGIMVPNSAGSIVSILATLMAGKTPVMINYSTGASENAEYAQQKCTFHTIITSRALLEKLGCRLVPGMIFLEDMMEQVGRHEKLLAVLKSWLPASWLARLVHPGTLNETATILFTSGSEKAPKAVELSHRNLASNVESAMQCFKFTAEDRVLANLPYFHVLGLMANLWLPLSGGMRVVTYGNPLDFKTIVRIIREEEISLLVGTPFFLMGYLKQSRPGDMASVRAAVAGADKCPASLRKGFAEKHNIELLEGYGATETSPLASVNLPGRNKHGSIGRPVPGVQVRITDITTGEELPIGQEGNILVKGDLVMKGYLDDVEETSLKIKDGWYETGDMGMLDEDGYLWHRGRLKRFAKIGGEMVSLVQVESVIEKFLPDDIECCVVEVPDARKGAMIAVALNGKLNEQKLADSLKKELPAIALPRKYLFFEELPKMGSGKIDFRTTTEMVKTTLREETAQKSDAKSEKKPAGKTAQRTTPSK
jgi:acyl-[acyl-carrier-protein]-phospholipid O-acyltransferase/long-chain-fatty-acid--[acyl-carrier-protein] ligase